MLIGQGIFNNSNAGIKNIVITVANMIVPTELSIVSLCASDSCYRCRDNRRVPFCLVVTTLCRPKSYPGTSFSSPSALPATWYTQIDRVYSKVQPGTTSFICIILF